ncbi:MAG TPA: M14 family metallopeptidase [Dongiaceae bacterium]|nr:M14 family metallopeptidase [Dongiaceae bacterium]
MGEIFDFFSGNYTQARKAFREAAEGAGAAIESYHNPATGPGGIPLSTETARLGPVGAERLMIVLSGTHGVECFCGSGLQVGWLKSGLASEMPRGVALLLIHAINPSGFAWVRRVTEDNVDLNRNFIDHDRPPPVNAGYRELREAICPRDWPAGQAAADAVLEAYGRDHGAAALQAAITAGQYEDPEGVFYGGRAPTWSNRTLRRILQREGAGARHVGFIDLHTGLGPYAVGEVMNNHHPGDPGFQRVKDWFGAEATSVEEGSSSSAPLTGDTNLAVEQELPAAAVTGITLEYGTEPMKAMLDSIRADNWLHIHGRLDTPEGRSIKARIRQAFYPDRNDWRRMVWERAVEVMRRMAQALAES